MKLIMSLAHDRIVSLGLYYIDKGFVTKDEYDDLFRFFYEPYTALGGNGSTERIMRLVQRLPLSSEPSKPAKIQIVEEVQLRADDDENDRLRMETAEELVKRKITARILSDAKKIEEGEKLEDDEQRRRQEDQ
jgi:hypothetical protein